MAPERSKKNEGRRRGPKDIFLNAMVFHTNAEGQAVGPGEFNPVDGRRAARRARVNGASQTSTETAVVGAAKKFKLVSNTLREVPSSGPRPCRHREEASGPVQSGTSIARPQDIEAHDDVSIPPSDVFADQQRASASALPQGHQSGSTSPNGGDSSQTSLASPEDGGLSINPRSSRAHRMDVSLRHEPYPRPRLAGPVPSRRSTASFRSSDPSMTQFSMGMHPTPDPRLGEIFMGGGGLPQGYVRRPEYSEGGHAQWHHPAQSVAQQDAHPSGAQSVSQGFAGTAGVPHGPLPSFSASNTGRSNGSYGNGIGLGANILQQQALTSSTMRPGGYELPAPLTFPASGHGHRTVPSSFYSTPHIACGQPGGEGYLHTYGGQHASQPESRDGQEQQTGFVDEMSFDGQAYPPQAISSSMMLPGGSHQGVYGASNYEVGSGSTGGQYHAQEAQASAYGRYEEEVSGSVSPPTTTPSSWQDAGVEDPMDLAHGTYDGHVAGSEAESDQGATEFDGIDFDFDAPISPLSLSPIALPQVSPSHEQNSAASTPGGSDSGWSASPASAFIATPPAGTTLGDEVQVGPQGRLDDEQLSAQAFYSNPHGVAQSRLDDESFKIPAQGPDHPRGDLYLL